MAAHGRVGAAEADSPAGPRLPPTGLRAMARGTQIPNRSRPTRRRSAGTPPSGPTRGRRRHHGGCRWCRSARSAGSRRSTGRRASRPLTPGCRSRGPRPRRGLVQRWSPLRMATFADSDRKDPDATIITIKAARRGPEAKPGQKMHSHKTWDAALGPAARDSPATPQPLGRLRAELLDTRTIAAETAAERSIRAQCDSARAEMCAARSSFRVRTRRRASPVQWGTPVGQS